jgi:hypothetical protein
VCPRLQHGPGRIQLGRDALQESDRGRNLPLCPRHRETLSTRHGPRDVGRDGLSLAVPLKDPKGKVLGHLVAMDVKPMVLTAEEIEVF